MKNLIRKILIIIIFLKVNVSFAGDENIEFREHKGDVDIVVPTDGTEAPSVYYGGRSNGIFATGKAATNITNPRNQTSDKSTKDSGIHKEMTLFKLYKLFTADKQFSGGLYQINNLSDNQELFVTALHVLKISNLEEIKSKGLSIYLFKKPNGRFYDVGFIAKKESGSKIIEYLNLQNNRNNPEASLLDHKFEFYHFNLIDNQSEVTKSKSLAEVVSENSEYLFLNPINSLVGPASSGAVLFNNNLGFGSVVCLSEVNNVLQTKLVRVLKYSPLLSAQIVEVNDDDLSSFETDLNCQPYDGRRGGGD